jgi:hypothetical protein
VVFIRSSRSDVLAGTMPHWEESWDRPHAVTWNEGGHMRVFEVAEVLENTAERFSFRDTRGATFELLPMTLELYDKHVREHTIGKVHYSDLGKLLESFGQEW